MASMAPMPHSEQPGLKRNRFTRRSQVSPTMASSSSTAMARSGSRGGQLGDQPAAHGVPGQDRAPDAELVDGPTEQPAVRLEVGAAGGQPLGSAVSRGVDGDHLEAAGDDARQDLGVEQPFGREAVDDDERDTPRPQTAMPTR